jgi:hypothetical protein
MKRVNALIAVAMLAIAGCNLFGGGEEPAEPQPTTPPVAPVAPSGGPLAVGTPASGTFAPGLPVDQSGKPYIDYTFNVTAAGNYTFDLISTNTTEYDPYISLMQGTNEIAHDDDGGDQALQSRLTHSLQPGAYTVRVTRFGDSQVTQPVPFTLTATQAAAAPAAPAGGTTLAVGTPAAGVFAPTLPTDPSGKPYIDYTLNVTAAGNYRIDLVSSDTTNYDPYISLMQGTNELANDDDSGDGALQSRLTHELQPGTYTVRVTKFGEGAVSAPVPFTLTVAPAT